MKKVFFFLLSILLLAGCSTKPLPVWMAGGHKHLEAFKQDLLIGRAPAITEVHFRKALEEIKRGGDTALLGKAWLTRMALQIAVREAFEESEYLRTEAAEAVPANRNFYRFLKGGDSAVEISLLPASYRPFWAAFRSGDAAKVAVTIAEIDDPLSRLIAAGLSSDHRMESEAILQIAVETASHNGWKRALLAWLGRLKSYHEAAGEREKASAIRLRIDLMR